MGGNALKLKGLLPKRINDSELQGITDSLSTLLIKNKVFKWIKPVKAYKNKTDHGDLDLIGELEEEFKLPPKKGEEQWHLIAKNLLNSKAIHWNKPVASLEYHGYQIDLTGRESHTRAKTHLEFSHYSPLGNILGRLIRTTGAKWGIDGLEYEIKEEDKQGSNIIKILPLSDSIDEILKFCGLNPTVWHQGFNTQEEIFNYACQSPLFNKEMFQMENLNHTHRKRDRTRPDYHAWLDYIAPNNVKNKCDYKTRTQSEIESPNIKESACLLIEQAFPKANLLKNIRESREENKRTKDIKTSKFNGHLVSQWTNLKGRELGNFIKGFKENLNLANEKSLLKWIESSEAPHIKRCVLDYQKSMQDNIQ
jgi:hypothetical protein